MSSRVRPGLGATARLLCAALLVLGAGVLLAQESGLTLQLEDEIARQEEILRQQQAEEERLARELAATTEEIQARAAERDRLSNRLTELRQEQEVLRREIAGLESELDVTRDEIAGLKVQLEHLQDRAQALLVSLHRQRAGRYARVLAQSETFHELQVRNYYLSLLTRQDADLVTELNDAVRALSEAQDRLSDQIRRLSAKQDELAANEQSLEAARAELDRVIAELQETQEGQEALKLSAVQAQNELARTIATLQQRREAEIERLRQEALDRRRQAEAAVEERERRRLEGEADAAERAADELAAPLPPPAESGFIYPVAEPRLVFNFGEEGTFVVLQAPGPGVEVVAVMSGRVANRPSYTANSGYVVMIEHGNGLITVYQNLTDPLVTIGDQVAQGDVIGHLGGSSLYRPDWLHFHVGVLDGGRIRYVDPANQLGF